MYSCGNKPVKPNFCCIYNSDKLFSEYTEKTLDTTYYEDGEFLEVIDKGSDIGSRGIYKFDKNKKLRFYAFLLNTQNEYDFSRVYDSTGCLVEQSGSEVVQWYLRPQKDSIKITFYLFGLKKTYSDVSVFSKSIGEIPVKLFKSPIFSNLQVGSFMVSNRVNEKFNIKGKMFEKCTERLDFFKDSVFITLHDSVVVSVLK